ncbi:MAG: hypothetical protein IPN17_08330 [Deltaproteobacteria bacterium]|nr:hypothetical protein [Deltaproteobacteria bacterium]
MGRRRALPHRAPRGATAVPTPATTPSSCGSWGGSSPQPLDRRHPLWEASLVEASPAGASPSSSSSTTRWSTASRASACWPRWLRTEPGDLSPSPAPWTPRHAPNTLQIATALASDSARSVAHALHDLRGSLGHGAQAKDIAEGLVHTLRDGLRPASPSSINPAEVGPHRTYTSTRLDLARAKEARKALGGTLNDVAPAVVTGGAARYLGRRGDPWMR